MTSGGRTVPTKKASTRSEAPPAQPHDHPVAAAVRGGVRAVGAERLAGRQRGPRTGRRGPRRRRAGRVVSVFLRRFGRGGQLAREVFQTRRPGGGRSAGPGGLAVV